MMPKRRARSSGRHNSRNRHRSSRTPRVEALEPRMLLTGIPYGAVGQDTGEYMLGDVVVSVVFFESDGTIDANQEDWNLLQRDAQGNVITDSEGRTISTSGPNLIEETKDRIIEGMQWWEDSLANFYDANYDDVEQVHSLNFIYDFEYAHNPVPTQYEPINTSSDDYLLWVGDFLVASGFLDTRVMSTDIRSFNNSQRLAYDADWAFTIFVANDHNDDDGKFPADGRFTQAFAYSGGRHLVSPASRPASTFAHETGHIFYARDEYAGSGASFEDHRGYYNTQNWNAYDNDTAGWVQQPSIMDYGLDRVEAWDTHTSSESSLAMIGWQDSDGDGVFDVLDVPLTLSGTGYYDPHSGLYHFVGHSQVQALVNVNSSGLRNDISINEVSRLAYSLDDGLSWSVARNFNKPEVDIDEVLSVPLGQDLLFRTEAIDPITGQIVATSNQVLHANSELPSSATQPGVNGFVWDDRDGDGQWDEGERGVSGWTLTLVDAEGAAIETAQYLETDEYADGSELNGVLSGVTLSAIGWDTKHSGVAAISNDVAAAGDRVLGSAQFDFMTEDTWLTEWTDSSRVLRIDMSEPTTFVSIDAIAPADGAYGRMEVYDTAGNLLGRTTTGALQESETARLAMGVASPQIAYALVSAVGTTTVLLDNLQVGPSHSVQSGYFGAYALPYQPAGEYHVMAVPGDGWDVGAPAAGVVTVLVDATGTMLWPDGSGRPSDFAAVPSVNASPWTNLAYPIDVNDDWKLTASDILEVVFDLNTNGYRILSETNAAAPEPFLDVNGDGKLSARDVLIVVRDYNDNVRGGGAADDAGSTAISITGWAGGHLAEGESVQRPDGMSADAQDSLAAGVGRQAAGESQDLFSSSTLLAPLPDAAARAHNARSLAMRQAREAVFGMLASLDANDDTLVNDLLAPRK